MYSRSLSLGSSGEVGRPVAELGVIHPFEAKEEEMERNPAWSTPGIMVSYEIA